jgi:hypothetical protein
MFCVDRSSSDFLHPSLGILFFSPVSGSFPPFDRDAAAQTIKQMAGAITKTGKKFGNEGGKKGGAILL